MNLAGARAYAVGKRMTVLDVADWSQISELSNEPMIGDVLGTDSQLLGDTLFVTQDADGVRSYDVSDPTAPVPIAQYPEPYALAIEVKETSGQPLVFEALHNRGARIVSFPASGVATDWVNVGQLPGCSVAACSVKTIHLQDALLALGFVGGFRLFELGYQPAPALPTVTPRGSYTQTEVAGVTLSSDARHAYLASSAAGLEVLDISDNAAPVKAGELTFSAPSVAIARYSEGHVVLGNSDRLHFVDVADPADPVVLFSFDLDGAASLNPFSRIKLGQDGTTCLVDQTDNIARFMKPSQFAHTGEESISTPAGAPATIVLGAYVKAGRLQSDLRYELVVPPTKGSLGSLPAVPATGSASVKYTPAAGLSGGDRLVYEICDNQQPPACSEAIVVKISIGP